MADYTGKILKINYGDDTYTLDSAPKSSPAFTGTPTAPTAASGTNTTQIATTAFVKTAIDNAATGNVTGPNSSTDAHVAVFDGATGKAIKDSGFTIGKSVPSDAKFTDTTYSSKAAESGGTDVSLVTTGEKAAWDAAVQSAGTGLSKSGTTLNHSNSVTAGTAGTSSATSGATLDVPYVTYDAQGHVTGAGTHTHTVSGFIPSSQKGTASGVAELDANGKVLSSQLPSYVDDVLEYDSETDFPATGETGKIYIAKDTSLAYRWSGSAYAEISPSLALGETSSTAYRGDRGKTAYDHAMDSSRLTVAQNSGLYKVAVTAEGHIAGVSVVQKSDITGLGIPAQDTTYSSEAAASGGTTLSLVTTGEKFIWNKEHIGQYASESAFPATGEDGSLYIAKNTAEIFRWDSTNNEYVPVGGSDGTVMTPVTFTIAVSDWTAVTGGYSASITSQQITASSEEIIIYTDSLKNLTSNVKVTKDGTTGTMTFETATVPGGSVSGKIFVFDVNVARNPLPGVSSTDNGKVLQVINGVWAAAYIPNASGVRF